MSTSEHKGFIRGLTPQLISTAPLDTAHARDGIVNNANHLADESTQTLINWQSPVAGIAQVVVPTVDFERMENVPTWQVPVRLRSDMSTVRLVVTARARVSAPGTAFFRFFMRIYGDTAAAPDPSVGYTSAFDASTTSTTGADLGPGLIFHSSAGVSTGIRRGALITMPTLDPSGVVEWSLVLRAHIEVWARSSAGGSAPILDGLTVREYIGL